MDMVPKVLLVLLWIRAEVRERSVGQYGCVCGGGNAKAFLHNCEKGCLIWSEWRM